LSPGTYVCTWGTAGRPETAPRGKLRTREYLTEAEVERLMAAAKQPLWPPRRHDGLCGLQARPTCVRTGESALGAGRLQNGDPVIRQARQRLAAVAGRDGT
jgi:hypothetical protein